MTGGRHRWSGGGKTSEPGAKVAARVTRGDLRKCVTALSFAAGRSRYVVVGVDLWVEASAHRIVWDMDSSSYGHNAKEFPVQTVECGSPDDPNNRSAGRGL